MRKMIVIDGLDGSGKETQTNLLKEFLITRKISVKKIDFPNYQSKSSTLVQMYLNGEISEDPMQVNPYAAASFYACDRYIDYYQHWKKDYEQGKIILADRYISSNAIHQMVKLPKTEWESFLLWLYDYEHTKLGLPKEDLLFYLDMNPAISQLLLNKRYKNNLHKKDIHEKNKEYLIACREAALFAANFYHWIVISCDNSVHAYSIQEIFEKIQMKAEAFLDGGF